MSNIKLFRANGSQVGQLNGTSVAVERSLQPLIEHHLAVEFGVLLLLSAPVLRGWTALDVGPGRHMVAGTEEGQPIGCPSSLEPV